ncbi:lysis protein [Pragia fontium]|uniref:lysis protein n=1 Tax=Pragia fontium TaxID=82985 RepID=UPI000699EC3D|nr:lysis protein [Pragia fontium]
MINIKSIALSVALAAFFTLIYCLLIQTQRLDEAKKEVSELGLTLAAEQKDKAELEEKNRKISETDDRLTKELVSAKNEIERIRADVGDGKRRLLVSAKCPKASKPSATGLDDATTARLTDSAQRDYFTLRERAEQSRLMIIGLQEYIRDTCL